MHGNKKTIATLKKLAAKYHLTFAGRTSKGHYLWRHEPTGRLVTSISCLANHRAISNVERTFKRRIREYTEQGAYDGPDGED